MVHVLLDSLDDPSDADIQELWLKEAHKRAAEIDSGKVKLVSGEDLERQVTAIFKANIGSTLMLRKSTSSRSPTTRKRKQG